MYVSLFPQLVAGPIVRYSTIEKEIDKKADFTGFVEGEPATFVALVLLVYTKKIKREIL